MPEIEIRFRNETEYHRLRAIRDKYGVQWRGMLMQGAKRLEGRENWFTARNRGDDATASSQASTTDRSHKHDNQRSEELPESGRHKSPDSSAGDQNGAASLFDSRGALRTLDNGADHERPSVDEFSPVEVER